VGFPRGRVPEAQLVEVAAGERETLDVPGLGGCASTAVPLDDDAAGRLVLARAGDDPFSREDVNLARGMSRVLTITLRLIRVLGDERRQASENARLLASLQERQRLLEQLSNLQRCISHRTPITEVFDAIVAGASELVTGETCALWLVDPNDPSELVMTAALDLDGVEMLRPGTRVPAAMGAAGRAMLEGAVVEIADYQENRARVPELAAAGVASALAAPLHEHGSVIGSIVVSSRTRIPAYGDVEREMLTLFAEQASVALAAARTANTMRQAFNDSLTGLPNRALLLDRMELTLARAERDGRDVTVLFLDLDGFKPINDSLGHLAGDRLLIEVARRLKDCLRRAETAARLGGDEFAILLADLDDPVRATEVAARVIAALERPFTLLGREVFVSASIGIASGREAPEDLLRNADVAMYRAKRDGGDRYCVFEPTMHAAVVDRLELEADLRRAVERDELVLHFQPIVDLETGRLEGAEALLRWNHPTRGLVAPLDFVPLAEETGLIVSLDRWVISEACRHAARWAERFGHAAPEWVSANLSGRHLLDGSFEEHVVRSLREAALEPRRLTLEITETVLVQDVALAVERLERLKALGVRLAIDDFGTGYSSLRYVGRFPADFLKIAKPFVDGVHDDEKDAALVRTIVTLGRSLGMQPIAEGVERPQQLERLRELGSAYGQGYLFARPLPAESLERLLGQADAAVAA
jgi:diguanylate cyclase (GGDEF)-like protein